MHKSGQKKIARKKQKLEDDAVGHCELIDDKGFWCWLKSFIDDLEPICLGTNLNQTDTLHPDQALLTFAGIFLYFRKHTKPSVAARMMKRVEKGWKALNQPMFILALVLNPFKGVLCFRERAGISLFTLNTVLLAVRFNCDQVIILVTVFTTRCTNMFILHHQKFLTQQMRQKHTKKYSWENRRRFLKDFLATWALKACLRTGRETRNPKHSCKPVHLSKD